MRVRRRWFLRGVLVGAAALGVSVFVDSPARAAEPGHLSWATSVARNVTPANNAYGSNPTVLTWPGVGGSTIYSNRSECSPFVTRVLKQAYGWSSTYYTGWIGSSSPNSAQYHDAVVAQNRFTRITKIGDVLSGDLIAVKYLTPTASSTGHTMFAVSAPVARTATKPVISGTTQYEVQVVDSSSSGHGTTDTRYRPDGTFEDGVGIGIARLYADASGTIVGYSWSTSTGSVFYDASTRPLAVGRL